MSNFKRIDEIAKVRRGASPRPIDDQKWFGGNVGWVRIIDVTRSKRYLRSTEQYLSPLGETKSVRVDKGDVIMSICATIGRPVIVDMPACIHDGFVQFYDIKNANAEYLYYALQHAEQDFINYGQTGTQANLNTTIVGKHTLFVPSFPEQLKIAQILTTVDILIEKTEALIAKYQAIKQGMMHDLFTRGVDSRGHLRPTYEKAPKLYKESELGWIPKEWRIGSITDFVDANDSNAIKPGPFGSSLKKESYVEIGYKIYGQEQVIGGSVRIGNYYISQSKFNELYAFRIKPNDILMSLVGTVGKILIIPHDCEEGIINPRLIKISPDVERTCPEFLAHLLLSDIVKRQLSRLSHGLTMEVLSATTLKRVRFPIPLRNEQNRIVSCIASLNNKIVREQESLEKYCLLKTGLMQNLLTGKVRVNVDETEEAAANV